MNTSRACDIPKDEKLVDITLNHRRHCDIRNRLKLCTNGLPDEFRMGLFQSRNALAYGLYADF